MGVAGEYNCIPELLQCMRDQPDRPERFLFKRDGKWQSWSTQKVLEVVDELALGLYDIGVRRGDCICLVGSTNHEYAATYLALASIGATPVPMFLQLAPEFFNYQLEDAAVRGIIVWGEERGQDVLQHSYPFEWVCLARATQMQGDFIHWEELADRGRRLGLEQPQLLESLRAAVQPEDLQQIIYTSGTTGQPKGVELTHAAIASVSKQVNAAFPMTGRLRTAALPFAHSYESANLMIALYGQVDLAFVEDIQELIASAREVDVHFIIAVPRILQKVHARLFEAVEELSPLKRMLGKLAINVSNNGPLRGWRRLLAPILEPLVFKRWRAAFGQRIEFIISGSAPLDHRLIHFFDNIGITIIEGYGLTENSAALTCNTFEHRRIGTVGRPLPQTEIKIGENDEILARGPQLMRGYRNKPKITAETIDKEGWLHTGDRGSLDKDGFLTITGRIKDLQKTAGGKFVVPAPIEHALMRSPLIEQALVIAEGRAAVAVLLVANPDEMERLKTRYGSEAEAERDRRAKKLIDNVNKQRPHWSWIKLWAWIEEELTIDNEMLTPTMKLRRSEVEKRYKERIEALYAEGAARLKEGASSSN